MTEQRFRATIEQAQGVVFLALPFDPNGVWGEKERHYVTGSVDGHPVRGALTKQGEVYRLVVGAAWRRDHPLTEGDRVEVVLTPEGPQLEGLAPDLVAALEAAPEAKAFFAALATFYRKGYLRWIDGARRPEARAERIAEVVRLLAAGKKQR